MASRSYPRSEPCTRCGEPVTARIRGAAKVGLTYLATAAAVTAWDNHKAQQQQRQEEPYQQYEELPQEYHPQTLPDSGRHHVQPVHHIPAPRKR